MESGVPIADLLRHHEEYAGNVFLTSQSSCISTLQTLVQLLGSAVSLKKG